MPKKYLLLIFMFSFSSARSLSHTVGFSAGLESNINFPTRGVSSMLYRLGNRGDYAVQAGFMIKPGTFVLTSWHLQASSAQWFTPGLQFHVKAMNTRYHQFERADNSLQFYTSYHWKWLQAALGMNVRFLNLDQDLQSWAFYYPLDLVQWHWMWRVAFSLEWKMLPLRTDLVLRNFSDHYAGNGFVISYHVVNSWQVNDYHNLSLDAGFHPSGLTGMSTIYNKFTLDLNWELNL